MIRRSERKRRRPVFYSPPACPAPKSKKYDSTTKIQRSNLVVDEPERNKNQQRIKFDDLPPEVLEMIFRFLPYNTISSQIRLVSKKCSAVSTAILNSAFLAAGVKIRDALDYSQSRSTVSDNAYLRAVYNRVYNYLELIKAQYELLRACCWRYTHPTGDRPFGRLCFYGGLILEELDCIIDNVKRRPQDLIGVEGPSSRIIEFSLMCKTFMNFFEKVSERRVNKSSLISGCKAVDVLDCLLIGREVLNCRITNPRQNPNEATVSMKIRYEMRRAWFTCLEVPCEGRNQTVDSWRDQQRYMYLRLRRLVGIVNEHYLESKHYEKEMMHGSDLLPPVKQLPNSTYTGYGECGGRFYFYGNMNEFAYDHAIIDSWRKNLVRDKVLKRTPTEKPSYNLVIIVDLKCSPELAPLSVRSILPRDDFDKSLDNTSNNRSHQMYLKISIHCPASVSNRLPGLFTWELRRHRRCKP